MWELYIDNFLLVKWTDNRAWSLKPWWLGAVVSRSLKPKTCFLSLEFVMLNINLKIFPEHILKLKMMQQSAFWVYYYFFLLLSVTY